MAFTLRCIESECLRLCVSGSELEELLDLLWRFVESKQLGEWEDKTRGCDCLTALVDEIDGMRPRIGESASWPEHLRRMVYDAYGRHGSIAVIERFMRTLKSEGLRRVLVPLRLDAMCSAVASVVGWYNEVRPHEALAAQLRVKCTTGACRRTGYLGSNLPPAIR